MKKNVTDVCLLYSIYPSTYPWNWYSITPTIIPAGNYIVSAYVRTYYYRGYFPGTNQYPGGPTPEGIVEPTSVRYRSGSGYPMYSISSSILPMVDSQYAYSYQVPDVLEDSASVFVDNAKPVPVNPHAIDEPGQEGSPIGFTGSFLDAGEDDDWWFRWTWGDGDQTDWIPVVRTPPYKMLFACALGVNRTYESTLTAVRGALPSNVQLDDWDLTDGNPTLAEMLEYDVILTATWGYPADVVEWGDLLADWSDLGRGVVQMNSFDGGDWWKVSGRWEDEGYSAIEYGYPEEFNVVRNLGTIYEPGHQIMNGVSAMSTEYRFPTSTVPTGSTLLADYDNGFVLGACWDGETPENPGKGNTVGLNWQPHDGTTGDADKMIANAILWAAVSKSPIIPTIEHPFMDNGVYDVYLQIIDDDMKWDFSSGQPVFTGTGLPGDCEEDWIGGTHFLTEIANTDPVISPEIRAYVELDLSIRVTGQPNEDVEMRLYKGSTLLGSVVCQHDQNEKIKVMSGVTLDMTEINDYRVEMEYFGTGSGANPTWIFYGHFPSGKIKELKHEFKDGDPIWLIGPDILKKMILGEDMIFEADVYDRGSDDLACIWSFGDSTPFGVHIYANDDPDVLVGVSDEATIIFNQDPDREPWFEKSANDIRSPWGTDMPITDTISHAFDENQPYYYYVHLTVVDDDVGDDYPSTQLSLMPGMDIECVQIDLS